MPAFTQISGLLLQSIVTQLQALEPAEDGSVGFMDAETATFASRIRRVMKGKVDELQASSPADSGAALHLHSTSAQRGCKPI